MRQPPAGSRALQADCALSSITSDEVDSSGNF